MSKKHDNTDHNDKKEPSEKDFVKEVTNGELVEQLKETNRVMQNIKAQFGYTGYSNPNYIDLEKTIVANEKLLASLDGK